LNVTGRPLQEDAGVAGGVIVMRDVSEKKAAQVRLSEFYALLSHELRTPLTSIRGSMDLIQNGVVGELPVRAKALVTIAQDESARMLRLINELLDLTKIEAGQMSFKFASILAQTLVEKTINGVGGLSREAGVTVLARVTTEAIVYCDEDRIVQVLTNFLSNAIKFSPRDSEVHVDVVDDGGFVKFSVVDTGPGITKEQMAKLFMKFQQLTSTKSEYKGTGLGLAITKSIVEQHGGETGVDSEVGKGSTFWFTLPKPEPAGA
jgi:signal transduction histidine kinase